MVLGIAFEKENVAYMVMLAFVIACSGNFPVLFMSVLWKNCTTRGAVVGGFVGLLLAVVLTIGSASVWVAVLGQPERLRLVPLQLRCHLLDVRRVLHDLAGVHPGQLRPGQEGTCAVSGPATPLGNRPRCSRRLRPLSRRNTVIQKPGFRPGLFFVHFWLFFRVDRDRAIAVRKRNCAPHQWPGGEFDRLAEFVRETGRGRPVQDRATP